MRADAAAWVRARAAWLLPVAVVAYLLNVHFRVGFLGLPYWASLVGPAVVLVAPWTIVATLRGGTADPRWRSVLFVAAVATLVAVALAWPLDLVPHDRLGRRSLAVVAAVASALAVLGAAIGGRTRRLPGATDILIAIVLASMIETDLYVTSYWFDRDFHILLRAGNNFLADRTVYSILPAADLARDPSLAPFVYPPVTLPFLALLASLPLHVAEAVWLGLGIFAAVASMRLFGVQWRCVPLVLLWPPFVQAAFVGNADLPVLVFFAAAPVAGALLALPALVKLQLGIPGLWLLRDRRWRDVAGAIAVGVLLVVATLPFVGVGLWRDWLDQLGAFARFVAENPPAQGIALGRIVGSAAAIGAGVLALGTALLRRGRGGLASLGVVSLIVSPTLYPHGLTLALPALLRLRTGVFWLGIAVTSTVYGTDWYWIVLAVAVVAPAIARLVHQPSDDPERHPLGAAAEPWPHIETGLSPWAIRSGAARSVGQSPD